MAATRSDNPVRLSATIEVPPSMAKKISESGMELHAFIESILKAIDSGALLVPAPVIRDVRRMWPDFDLAKLPELVSKALEITETAVDCRVRIDPYYLGSLKEIAAASGRDLRELLQAAVNHMIDSGWLWESLPVPIVIRLTAEQLESIARSLGIDKRDVSGSLLAKTLEALCRSSKPAA